MMTNIYAASTLSTKCDAGPSLFSISNERHVPWPGRTAEGIFISTQDYAELSLLFFPFFFFFELSFLIMTYSHCVLQLISNF